MINFKEEHKKDLLKFFGVFIFLLSSLILQSLIFSKKDLLSGIIGNSIVDSLFPFVGLAGLWLFVLIGYLITLLIFMEGKEIKKPNFNKITNNIKINSDINILHSKKRTEEKREKKRK